MQVRSVLNACALCGLVTATADTVNAIYGAKPLPARVATHFNRAGQPDGWGSPHSLWIILAVAAGAYGLMTVVARFPATFSYPVAVTEENRKRLQEIALSALAWLKAEIVLFLAALQIAVIRIVGLGSGTLPVWIPFVFLAVIFATIGWHKAQMSRARDMKAYSAG